MKFNCSQYELIKAINTVSKAVSTRTTIPVLKGILLTATQNGKLKLSASDLEISIETEIEASVEVEGSSVVAAKLFMDIIRKLPEENIIFNEENGKILLKSGKSEFEIIGMDPGDFPNISEKNDYKEKVSIEKEILSEMINKTAFSASVDEAKGIIVGLLIEIEKNTINMVALDGYRMAVLREVTAEENESKSIIIAAKVMGEISKIISDTDDIEKVVIMIENKKALINAGKTKIVLRLMDGEFVKYRDILPKESKTSIVVNKNYLLESMERASLLAKDGKNNLIKLNVKEGLLTITSKSEEGNVKEEVFIEKKGEDIEIGFNSKYIIEALKVIKDDNVKFEFNSSVMPCVIRPVGNIEYDYLILPVRIAAN